MISPELRELVEQANAARIATALSLPSSPPAGERTAQWLEAVARARREWDAAALASVNTAEVPTVPVRGVGDLAIPAADGDLPARMYVPDGDDPKPAIAFFHGGGFWMAGGEAAMTLGDLPCRILASQLGAVVINVDYRLAPEHPYPTSVDDCYAATAWIAENSDSLGVDPARLALLGISSGGALAAATARRCRDLGGPALCAQVLLVPVVDLSQSPGSLTFPEIDDGLDIEQVKAILDLYLGSGVNPYDPDVSPGLDPDMRGMPATFVVTAEHDVLCSQGEAYVERLRAAGVDATGRRYPMTHSVATPETVMAYMTDIVGACARAFAQSSSDRLNG